MSTPDKIEFKAEIKKLLHILSQSLYQHKEIFLRELISNASDALKKMHFISLQNKDVENPDLPLEVEVLFNAKEKTVTVHDTGIGMTRAEMIENIGTIAGSGTEKFLQHLMETNDKQSKELDLDIIGRFGVGFYSVFMVADKVQVISKSYLKGEPAHLWESTGSSEFTIAPVEQVTRGTSVIVYMKPDETEFLSRWQIESVIKKYSNFLPFPVFVTEVKSPEEIEKEKKEEEERKKKKAAEKAGKKEGEEQKGKEEKAPEVPPPRKPVNETLPLWKRPAAEINEEDYKNFYHFISNRYDNYAHVMNYRVDGQVQFSSICFVPESKTREVMQPELDYGLTLYSRNVMIMQRCKDIMPQWMRFVQGVVESEDIPLNVSRDTIQANRLILKIKDLISKRLISDLKTLADKEPKKFLAIWKEYGFFLKEGLVTDAAHREDLLKLLRFQTSRTKGDELRSLDDYVQTMVKDHPDQKEIYYLVGENLQTLRISPHMGFYDKNNIEVIWFTDSVDNFLMMNVHDYKTKVGEGETAKEYTLTFTSIDVSAETAKEKEKKKGKKKDEKEEEKKPEKEVPEDTRKFLDLVKSLLGNKIMDARVSDRLFESACRLAMPAGGISSSMERAMRYWTQNTSGKQFQIPRKIFEFNPEHPIIKALIQLYTQDPLNGKIKPVVQQLFENCLLAEGDLPDPAKMVPRLNQLLEMLATGRTDVKIPASAEEEEPSPESAKEPLDFDMDEEEPEVMDAEMVKDKPAGEKEKVETANEPPKTGDMNESGAEKKEKPAKRAKKTKK